MQALVLNIYSYITAIPSINNNKYLKCLAALIHSICDSVDLLLLNILLSPRDLTTMIECVIARDKHKPLPEIVQ